MPKRPFGGWHILPPFADIVYHEVFTWPPETWKQLLLHPKKIEKHGFFFVLFCLLSYCFLFCKFSIHFYHFSTEILIHLLLACGKSCYVKEINTLSVIGIAHISAIYHLIFEFVSRNLGHVKNVYSYVVKFISCVPWLSSTQNLSEIIFKISPFLLVLCYGLDVCVPLKWEKEYVKAVYCHPAYLTYM